MILIIGGAGQGKLDYVLNRTGCTPDQVARTPEQARTKPIFAGLEDWPELDEGGLLSANPDLGNEAFGFPIQLDFGDALRIQLDEAVAHRHGSILLFDLIDV